GVVGHGSQHEVLEPGLPQVVDTRVDTVDVSDHVALLEVLVTPMRTHDAEEGRLRLRHRLLVAHRIYKVYEVAVAEGELPLVASVVPRMLLELQPVALDPLLRARATREPVPRLYDAIHDGLRDDGHVVIGRIRRP